MRQIALSMALWLASWAVFSLLSDYLSGRIITRRAAKMWVEFEDSMKRVAANLGGFFIWNDDSTYGFAIPLADDPKETHDAERTNS